MQIRPEAVLVNVSSIFAMVSMPTQSIYNASKAAVRAFSDALREELHGTTVRVLCVHPGGIKTNIANKARVTDSTMIATSDEAFRSHFDKAARSTPAQAAKTIIRAIESNKTRVLIGADARILDWMFRLFPCQGLALVYQSQPCVHAQDAMTLPDHSQRQGIAHTRRALCQPARTFPTSPTI